MPDDNDFDPLRDVRTDMSTLFVAEKEAEEIALTAQRILAEQLGLDIENNTAYDLREELRPFADSWSTIMMIIQERSRGAAKKSSRL